MANSACVSDSHSGSDNRAVRDNSASGGSTDSDSDIGFETDDDDAVPSVEQKTFGASQFLLDWSAPGARHRSTQCSKPEHSDGQGGTAPASSKATEFRMLRSKAEQIRASCEGNTLPRPTYCRLSRTTWNRTR